MAASLYHAPQQSDRRSQKAVVSLPPGSYIQNHPNRTSLNGSVKAPLLPSAPWIPSLLDSKPLDFLTPTRIFPQAHRRPMARLAVAVPLHHRSLPSATPVPHAAANDTGSQSLENASGFIVAASAVVAHHHAKHLTRTLTRAALIRIRNINTRAPVYDESTFEFAAESMIFPLCCS